jgi:hypothetical protein
MATTEAKWKDKKKKKKAKVQDSSGAVLSEEGACPAQ